ncbi:MAG: 23S rRNA (guanosine-2'-O-)-methyltransferase RlmB [Planctomycetes bacterium ADurb.Bin126]|nr:MAG: 23S rRNA (guanosine-2'-O-)-methyltransferase RlmB [Planctomycetes bacterium ADurb.Bin126]
MRASGAIASLKDPIVADARRRLAAGAGESGACFLADGARMVRQAIEARSAIHVVFFLDGVEQDEDRQVLDLARQANLPCHLLQPGIFFKVLDLGYRTSVGCLAVVSRPPPAPLEDLPADACLLAGQSIQDPRNVGVLIRTADAWAATRAVFSADSADPWSRPAVRSTTGSIFRVPLTLSGDLGGELKRLRDRGLAVVGSSAHSRRPVWELDLRGPVVLLVGNETAGLPPDLLDLCDQAARIPMTGSAHSFNVTVAAGILLYECQRQRAGGWGTSA